MSRLIIVSNRLPFTLRQRGTSIESKPSSGGLVTALGAYVARQRERDPAFESLWVGWPGSDFEPEVQPKVEAALAEQHAKPIFLSKEDSDDFYYGFCNRTLWPLFHYFTSFVDYEPRLWETYVRVNRVFSDAVSKLARPGDTIWVHDYQLLLLPGLLRETHPRNAIGFFLHTPFPSHEIFRLLPVEWGQQLVEGMLGADLVGFHVHEYTQHFLHCVLRLTGRDHHLGQLAVGDQLRRADTFPLGVDFESFARTADSPAVTERRAQIALGLGERKVILSVDRLDYTKGLAERLRGYERFLERYPDWRGKVTFLLLVVPSRVEVSQYAELKHALDERVGAINGRFGTVDWAPIIYQYRSAPFDELVAMYRLADVALITPLRDGMNLVAKEYLACKTDDTGVLILSEMAGAAREMNEALLINPHHWEEIAEALERALTMPREEQVRRTRAIRDRLRIYDASQWANHFLSALGKLANRQGELAAKRLGPDLEGDLVRRHAEAKRALLLLDYDGTLVPIVARPELAAPDDELLELLARLTGSGKNIVYVISGRGKGSLEDWLGGTGVGIIAEHGAWLREPGGEFHLTRALSAAWKEEVGAILRLFAAQVSGSLLEEKEFSLAWHYRNADPELGSQRAKELVMELTQFTANLDLQILEGKKVVEVRSAGVNKGVAAADLVQRLEPDFTLAVGDDHTDEDLFRLLPDATTLHVGSPFSIARYHVRSPAEVRALLGRLASRS